MKFRLINAIALSAALSGNVLADLNDGLVAYYPFNGNAKDESGNDTQIHLNTGIYYVNGKIAQGIASTENDNGEQISVSKPFKQEFFTISYWNNAIINHNKTYGDTNISVWHSTEPNQRSFSFTTSSGNHSAYHQHEYPEINISDNINNSGKGTSLYYGKNQLNERQWHHILLTYENGNINVFVNGLPIIKNKLTSVSPVKRDMLIALRGDDMLDELRIYNRALSSQEIQQLYATTLETNISPKNSGTITKSPDKSSYSPNEEVTLTAKPAKGYKFKQWQGDASGSEATITIKMNGNQNVTAVFEKKNEISSKAIYDIKTKTLFLKGVLVPFLDGFSGEDTGDKGIFNVQLQEKIKDAFELIPWSINFKAMFEGEDTSGYINYDHETRSVYIPCFKVATIAEIGDGIEGKCDPLTANNNNNKKVYKLLA